MRFLDQKAVPARYQNVVGHSGGDSYPIRSDVRAFRLQICAELVDMDRTRDGNSSAGRLVFLTPRLATDVLERKMPSTMVKRFIRFERPEGVEADAPRGP